jgi:hypothetical protein
VCYRDPEGFALLITLSGAEAPAAWKQRTQRLASLFAVCVACRDPEAEGFVLLDYEEQEHQLAQLQQQQAAAAAAAADVEATVSPDALLASSSSSSTSSSDGEAEAAAGAAGAQQLPDVQQPQQEVQSELATVEFCFHCVTQPGEEYR